MGSLNSRESAFIVDLSLDNDEYSLKILYDHKKTMTEPYRGKMNVFRRGSYFVIHFLCKNKKKYKNVNLKIRAMNHPDNLRKAEEDLQNLLSYFEVKIETKRESEYIFTVNISTNASVGLYRLFIGDEEQAITDTLQFLIIFNPFDPSDDVYTQNKSDIDSYLFDTTTTLHYGSEDNYSYKKYQLNQFSVECLIVSSIYLFRIGITDRKSPLQVCRAISDFVNDSQDNGLMTLMNDDDKEGTYPSLWTNMSDIYEQYLNKNTPVRWGDFMVYAALITSLCRCIGIVCRNVTGFSINPGETDSDITTILFAENQLTVLKNSNNLWCYHCFNNVIIKSKLYLPLQSDENNVNSWHHLDGTRPKIQNELNKYGPYQINLLRKVISKAQNSDGKYIYSSLNKIIKYCIINIEGEIIKEFMKNKGGKLFLTSSKGTNTIDISNEYKDLKDKNQKVKIDQVYLDLNVDKCVKLGDELKYSIEVRNSSAGQISFMNLTLYLKNIHNSKIQKDQIDFKSFEFQNKDVIYKGSFTISLLLDTIDITKKVFQWELIYFDNDKQKLKIRTRSTYIKSIFKGDIIKPNLKWTPRSVDFAASIINQTSYSLKNVKVFVFLEKNTKWRREINLELGSKEKKSFWVQFKGIEPGVRKFIIMASYGLSVYKIGEITSFVFNI